MPRKKSICSSWRTFFNELAEDVETFAVSVENMMSQLNSVSVYVAELDKKLNDISQNVSRACYDQEQMICFCRDLFQKFVDMERKVSMLSERQGDPLKVLHKSYCELANLASNERCGEDVRSIGRTQKKSMAIAAQRSGIEFIDPKRGDKFDDRIHICGEYVNVSDLELDGMVYSCTSPGCRVGERIEEKAVVEVARCCRNISHNNRNSEEDDGMSLYDHTPSVSVSIESSEDTDNSEKSPRRLRPRITESYNVYSGQPLEYGRVPAESDTETKKPVDLLNTGDPREHSI